MSARKYILSLSGGKDSTAMLLRLLELGAPVDEIVYFDSGWEFPAMSKHIDTLEQYIGRKITRLHPRESFDYVLSSKPVTRRKKGDPMHGKVYRHGHGWPSMCRRWCTSSKCATIARHLPADAVTYIGFAADEQARSKGGLYPLQGWGWTEQKCLDFCRDKGFFFSGLYDHFSRVSCYRCPLKSLADFRTLRNFYPGLWQSMLSAANRIVSQQGRVFWHGKTLAELDAIFSSSP